MVSESQARSFASVMSGPLSGALGQAVAGARLIHRRWVHGFSNGVMSGRLAVGLWSPAAWAELLQMQQAALLRLQKQQESGLERCAELMRDFAQIHHANTFSKLLDQQHDVAARFAQILTDQATDLVELMEGVEVAYGYWLSEKLEAGA